MVMGSGCSSSTRGVIAGGPGTAFDAIDYVTISSGGGANDFGDLRAEDSYSTGCIKWCSWIICWWI